MADYATRMQAASTAQEKVVEASKKKSNPFNPDAALYRTADNMGLGDMKSDEVRFTIGETVFIAQGFTDGILYVEDGDWGNIRRVAWPAAPAAAGTSTGSTTESNRKEGGLSDGTTTGRSRSDGSGGTILEN